MKLLVVTPSLGKSRWLAETVESVAREAPGAVHVLVAPADKSAELAGRFPAVRLVRDPGGGMYAAINAGLEAVADWDAFTYINDDDVLLPGFARLRAAGEGASRPGLVYGGVRLIDQLGARLGGIPVSRFPSHNRALYAQRLEPVYQHGAVVARTAWEEVGGFDASLLYCGDSDFLARLCLAGVETRFVPGEAAAFRLRPGQLTKNRPAMDAERAMVDARLRLLDGVSRGVRLAAWVGFRLANALVYIERVRRQGWKRFDAVLADAG